LRALESDEFIETNYFYLSGNGTSLHYVDWTKANTGQFGSREEDRAVCADDTDG
jgi:hypothetical protein